MKKYYPTGYPTKHFGKDQKPSAAIFQISQNQFPVLLKPSLELVFLLWPSLGMDQRRSWLDPVASPIASLATILCELPFTCMHLHKANVLLSLATASQRCRWAMIMFHALIRILLSTCQCCCCKYFQPGAGACVLFNNVCCIDVPNVSGDFFFILSRCVAKYTTYTIHYCYTRYVLSAIHTTCALKLVSLHDA